MNTSENDRCRQCGAAVPAESTDKLCPACLMSGALEMPDDETVSAVPTGAPSSRAFLDFPVEFGGYRLIGLLGSGGMGAVYDAEQISTGRRVALKMLGQGLDSPEMRQRFLREGRIAAGVSHPNSLYIFGSEEIEDVPVITMEVAAGGTLKDRFKKRGPLPTTEAVDAILDVIAGLEAAFQAGVLHRDIKPSNCFVSPDGSVKIGDFGLSVSTLARDDSYVTATGVIMGTPAYASPEQLRGDDLDVRADIYSVGATLFTLLTGRAPFEGKNAVQVVTNVINQKPVALTALREDIPPGLERVVNRCLAKDPEGRFGDYKALRDALLPFSSREPEPASMKLRASTGWVDYLIAFLVPYVILMFAVGNEEFHLGYLMERTLYSARYHIAFLGFGILYFGIVEGIWGAGLGKRLKGLQVIRSNGRPPGIARALVRIIIPVLCIEGVRIPLLMATIKATEINAMTTAEIVIYSVATSVCPWIPLVFTLRASRENRFATVWDIASGTRVVVKPRGTSRPSIEPPARREVEVENGETVGPYRLVGEIIPGEWIVATDPVLRRQVWLQRRRSSHLSLARRNLARHCRLRWLQKVESGETVWDAFEAVQGVPFRTLIENGKRLPWGTLRHWLHDLSSELYAASGDETIPAELSLDNVWVTSQGHAVLLDEPYPGVGTPAESIPVGTIAGQQRFLNAVSSCVDTTGLPLHARPVLQNLQNGKFEKLSFLTGTLRGLLDRPAEIGKGVRAGSIFMLPFYVWIMLFVGTYTGEGPVVELLGDSVAWLAMSITMLVLMAGSLVEILALPIRFTPGHSIFRLAVVDAGGVPAAVSNLLCRWAIVWFPLFVPMALVALLVRRAEEIAFVSAMAVLLLWLGAVVYTVFHPHRGLHDRIAGTWVVRR